MLLISLLLFAHYSSGLDNPLHQSPLVFEVVSYDPQRVKVFWDPQVPLKQVLELSNREVRYKQDNDTEEIVEEFGNWHELVSEKDNDDGTRRYVFLKKSLCHEMEWKVRWVGQDGVTHGPVTQRLPSSPLPWSPRVTVTVHSFKYDPDRDLITVVASGKFEDERLPRNSNRKLSPISIAAELRGCSSYFQSPVPLPKTLEDGRTIEIPAEYARHRCDLWFRAKVLTWNSELKCRELQQTRDSVSKNLEFTCAMFNNLKCPPPPPQSCDMDCQTEVWAEADYRYHSNGDADPIIRVKWLPRMADRVVSSYAVRYSQIDSTFNNYPIKEFNVTVKEMGPEESGLELEPYHKDPDTSFGFQVCARYKNCRTEPLWKDVTQRRIRYNLFIYELPPPTKPTTPSSPTTPEPLLRDDIKVEQTNEPIDEPERPKSSFNRPVPEPNSVTSKRLITTTAPSRKITKTGVNASSRHFLTILPLFLWCLILY